MARATYQRFPLSASTNYLPINIAATTSASPTLLHEADAVNADEVWIQAYNYSANDALLHVMLGGGSAHQILSLPVLSQRGLITVLPGYTVTAGVDISAYADSTNIISVLGFVNRIVFI